MTTTKSLEAEQRWLDLDLAVDLLQRFKPILVMWPDPVELGKSLAEHLASDPTSIELDVSQSKYEQTFQGNPAFLEDALRSFSTQLGLRSSDYHPRPAQLILDSTLFVAHEPFKKDPDITTVARSLRGQRQGLLRAARVLSQVVSRLIDFVTLGFLRRFTGQTIRSAPSRWLAPSYLQSVENFRAKLGRHSETSEKSFLVLRSCGGPKNAAKHWRYYVATVWDKADNQYRKTVYGRVCREDPTGKGLVLLQYWYCYFYNDWANKHEGDWECITVIVKPRKEVRIPKTEAELVASDYEGYACGISNHLGGWRTYWDKLKREGKRPVIFVARGSHANYFHPGIYSPAVTVAGLPFRRSDLRFLGQFGRWFGDPHFRDETAPDMEDCYVRDFYLKFLGDSNPWWVNYSGLWGSPSPRRPFPFNDPGSEAPRGPKFHPSSAWRLPFSWVDEECSDWRTSFVAQK